EAPAAHPFDDGTALLLERGIDETAAGLGADGDAYRRIVEPLVAAWDELAPGLLGRLPPPARRALRMVDAVHASGLAAPGRAGRRSRTRGPSPTRRSRPTGRGRGSPATAPIRCCRSSAVRARASG